MNKLARKWILAIILISFILLVQYFSNSQVIASITPSNNAPLTLQNDIDRYLVGKSLEFATDPEATFDSNVSPESPAINLAFTKSTKDTPALGFTKNAYWARLSLQNNSPITEWYLAIGPAILDRVDLYILKNDRWQIHRSGRIYPFSQREVADHNFVFPIEIPANGEITVYLRFATASTLLIDANLYRSQAFWQERYSSQLWNGFLYGILVFTLIYNLFLFVSLKDRSYLYFVLSTTAFILHILVADGYGMQYLWQNAVWWNRILTSISVFLAIGATSYFTIEFLQTHLILPKLHRWLLILSTYSFTMVLICPFLPYRISALAHNSSVLIAFISYIVIGIIAMWKKIHIARLFLLTWSVFLVVIIIYLIVDILAILPLQISMINVYRASFIVTPILLSIALADRINQFQSEKIHNQQEKLYLKDKLNASLAKSRDELEKIVTERTRDLQKAKESAEIANLAKSEFLSNMSHELRTPLNAILGFTQLLQLDPSMDDSQQEELGYMASSGKHLLELINSVLDLSAIESGNLVLQEREFSLTSLLLELQENVKLKVFNKGLTLNMIIAEDLPDQILGDELKLRQILINLINNAIKFTEKGSITVKATSHNLQNDMCQLSFAVEDTGVGISPQNLKKLFTPFFQTEESRQQEGTGLGLSISQRLANAMGGEITVQSALGVGTTFTLQALLFPIIDAISEEEIIDETELVLQRNISPLRLLLAEDNNINRKVILNMLKKLGYKADTAENGREVLESLQKSSYDVILMDIRMPEMDGIEATRIIRDNQAIKNRPVIIAVTASALKEDCDRYFSIGIDDYISKPIRLNELNRVLQRASSKVT
ncbi:MAG: hypothetical protein DCF19_10175 [Pseudanabaena frigida]|uniref:Circadian input-output histidine kinase CikA n=1 Tax=Pseudanabaena frigida TaxID=945775 RepID=A0A2W4W9H0_9CYAN|nr:MAG: hypothetical protein DCF19_10175 [Pseudanabaena frigida]